MRQGRRLGVDVGSARVGVAMCDPEGILATPVATLPRDVGGGSDQERLGALIVDEAILEVVVGLPRHLSGHEGAAADVAREYALALAKRIRPVPVRLLDERLTTVDAQSRLRAAGRPGRAQRDVVDQVAAVLILQSALDLERSTGSPPGELVPSRKPRQRPSATKESFRDRSAG